MGGLTQNKAILLSASEAHTQFGQSLLLANKEFVTMSSPWVTSLICSVCLQVLSPCYWILVQSLEQNLPANLPSEDPFIPPSSHPQSLLLPQGP